uniref:MAGE domain-containing protein n=1 Tax=Caenorhabditis tropicalis TaxID=1561998 RepID=A0A1I7UI70_9PELO
MDTVFEGGACRRIKKDTVATRITVALAVLDFEKVGAHELIENLIEMHRAECEEKTKIVIEKDPAKFVDGKPILSALIGRGYISPSDSEDEGLEEVTGSKLASSARISWYLHKKLLKEARKRESENYVSPQQEIDSAPKLQPEFESDSEGTIER